MMINAANDYRVLINRNYDYENEMASLATYFLNRIILFKKI